MSGFTTRNRPPKANTCKSPLGGAIRASSSRRSAPCGASTPLTFTHPWLLLALVAATWAVIVLLALRVL